MPDITYPTTFADGNVVTALQVNNNIYHPTGTPDSLEVINGWLDNANREAGWSINRSHIRPRTMTNGRMVGLTGVLDYFDETFAVAEDEPDAYTPVSGMNIQVYLPYQPTIFVVMWQFNACSDAAAGAGVSVETRLYIDNAQVNSQRRSLPGAQVVTGSIETRRNRVWSGHWLRANANDTSVITAGHHSLGIRVWSQADTCRVRVRNIKCWWVR